MKHKKYYHLKEGERDRECVCMCVCERERNRERERERGVQGLVNNCSIRVVPLPETIPAGQGASTHREPLAGAVDPIDL